MGSRALYFVRPTQLIHYDVDQTETNHDIVHRHPSTSTTTSRQIPASTDSGASVIQLVARWTTYHYHLSSDLGVGISEGCFIFDFASVPLDFARPIYLLDKGGRKTSIINHPLNRQTRKVILSASKDPQPRHPISSSHLLSRQQAD